jgi:hypothetical protein
MKKNCFKIKYLFFFSLAIIFSSCRTMGTLYAPVYTRPVVELAPHIKKIGIVNRSLPVDNKGNKTWTTLEAILSGEGIMEDKNGSMAAMSGAEVQFNMDTFVRAYQLKEILLPGLGAGKMNAALNSDIIDSLCYINGFDALLVLEAFDTDQRNSQTSYALSELANAAITGRVDLNSRPPSYSEVYVSMSWRLYDNHKKIILDETNFGDNFGVNKYNYDLADFAKRDGIQTSSYIGGRAYVSRFYPAWVRVYRDFFRRKGPELKMAARMMDVGDLDGATKIWRQLTTHPNRKIAGRACFNTAIAVELTGDLDGALEWTQKSYAVYRIRQARHYSNFLMNRMRNSNIR